MLEGLHDLGLDPDRVQRQRDAAVGIARAYSARAAASEGARGRELSLYAGATNFRRAAAHSLLLGETSQAEELFQQAAATYLAVGASYGHFIGNLGYRERLGEDLLVEGRKEALLDEPRE